MANFFAPTDGYVEPSFASRQWSELTVQFDGARPDQTTSIRRTRARWHPRLTHRWLLAGVLLLQAGLSLRLLWANSAFEDEATYLYAGHLEWAHWLHGATSPTLLSFPTWLSGAPVVYPPLGALADSVGGLTGARLLSLAFMLGASCCLYGVTRRLLERTAGLFAVLAFAVLASTQLLGVFATYDPMAIFLMCFATWIGVSAASAKPVARLFMLPSAGLVLTLAAATKYATALWEPVTLVLIAIAGWQVRRLRTGLFYATIVGSCWVLSASVVVKIAGHTYVQGILFTTLSRAKGAESPLLVLNQGFGLIWIVLILGVLALLSSYSDKPPTRVLCLTVLAAGLLAPLNEARLHTTTSLWKHADFGAWFTAIGAGYLLARLSRIDRRTAWRVALAGVVGLTLIGSLNYSAVLATRWWPNSTGVIKALNFVRPSTGPILMNAFSVGDYYLHAHVYPGQIAGMGYGFPWWNGHAEVTGVPAVIAAIRSRHFAVIEIDGQATNASEYWTAYRQLRRKSGYRMIYNEPWTYHGDRFYQEVWMLVKA